MKRNLQLAVGVVVSAFFIYLALPGLHLPTVVESLRTANYWWLVPGVAVYIVGLWVRTWRWQYTLRPVKLVPVVTLFPMVCIGYFGNNVFPFRAGELLRSYVLKKQRRYRHLVQPGHGDYRTSYRRAGDDDVRLPGTALCPHAGVLSQRRDRHDGSVPAATAVFIWMASQPERVERFYALLASVVLPGRVRERTDDLYHRFMLGLRSLSEPTDVIMIFFTSVLIWLLETVKYWFVMHAFDFQVSFLVLMLMNGLVNLATTLPAAPGYIGTFDTPGIKTLADLWRRSVDGGQLHLHAACGTVAAGDVAGRLLLLARAPAA